ncbi:hypothetical protein ACIGW1_05510 [Streptomyces sp. NPDC053780]|uniref:hypothetical protein n=1 Tax=unclassified Streptomyces TaxID=2593676 RepID=UPI0034248654
MPGPIWFAPWKPGPAGRTGPDTGPGGPAVVSVTEFAPHRPWTSLGVNVAGAALRRGWGDVEGAIGLWLWSVPGLSRPRSGSVSVWRDEDGLRGFVARHDHVRIMRAYRDRGALRSTTWHTDRFDRNATQEDARGIIAEWSAQPVC